jgi:hypothetical protein
MRVSFGIGPPPGSASGAAVTFRCNGLSASVILSLSERVLRGLGGDNIERALLADALVPALGTHLPRMRLRHHYPRHFEKIFEGLSHGFSPVPSEPAKCGTAFLGYLNCVCHGIHLLSVKGFPADFSCFVGVSNYALPSFQVNGKSAKQGHVSIIKYWDSGGRSRD